MESRPQIHRKISQHTAASRCVKTHGDYFIYDSNGSEPPDRAGDRRELNSRANKDYGKRVAVAQTRAPPAVRLLLSILTPYRELCDFKFQIWGFCEARVYPRDPRNPRFFYAALIRT